MTGLFFGSFNPVHNGHLQIAEYILNHGLCEEVWFIVSPQNPFKANAALLDANKRFEILETALEGREQMKACNIEFNMPKPSYTIDTLLKISALYPEKTFALIIGADNLRNFHHWKDHETIVSRWQTFVYPRPDTDTLSDTDPHITRIDAPLFSVSSTEIRRKIQKGEDISSLVPLAALQPILQYYK